jgi:pyruvate/2-oxoglutarate dehydrogenase complex dihydrolipoamide acyltransferase (E2) component
MKQTNYQVVPFPKSRQPIVDYLSVAKNKHTIHALIEVDVTQPRRFIQKHKATTGESLSFTAFVIACLARAIDENKVLHAYRASRNRLVLFDEVDVNTLVEHDIQGQRIGTPYVIRAANTKTFLEIHREIRTAQVEEAGAYKRIDWYRWLPHIVGRFMWRVLGWDPHLRKKYTGTVCVTAVGMFGKGTGWGIPTTDYTLLVTLGGIAEKPGVVDGRIEIREYLSLTISVDHDIVDGAPAARFAQRLRELIENGDGLIDLHTASAQNTAEVGIGETAR